MWKGFASFLSLAVHRKDTYSKRNLEDQGKRVDNEEFRDIRNPPQALNFSNESQTNRCT